MKNKLFLVYKITNLLNNKIYIGVHETFNINDSYMGSGKILNYSYKKYGKENFKKEILHIFDSKKQMLDKERELVNESFVKREDTYNCIIGGVLNTSGFVNVKDSSGECFLVPVDDDRYLSGELVGITKGMVNVRNSDGDIIQVTQEEFKNDDNLCGLASGITTVRDKDGNRFSVDIDDPRYLSGELVSITTGFVPVYDDEGTCHSLNRDSDEYKSGKYKSFFEGKKHSKETIEKMKESRRGRGSGSNNSQYGKKWIYSLEEKRSIKVDKNQISDYLKSGWFLGRKMKF